MCLDGQLGWPQGFLATWLCLILNIAMFIVIVLSQIDFFFFYTLYALHACLSAIIHDDDDNDNKDHTAKWRLPDSRSKTEAYA